MNKVTYFDVEYANSQNKSICQMGLLCENYENGEPFYPERNLYINPEDGFDEMCIRIHGITEDKVKSEPTFPTIWDGVEKYFTNAVIIGHNVASADLDALSKSLRRYNIDIPEFYYICTLELAKEYVPSYSTSNYGMAALCTYFNIDIDSAHDAFDDACANADLFRALVSTYNIDIDSHIKKYIPHDIKQTEQYISSPSVRKSISEFYGIVRGFSIDDEITKEETEYIGSWREKNIKYTAHEEFAEIIKTIDMILADGIVTAKEITILQKTIKSYLDIVSTSPITLATQILDGIMKGIILDGKVTDEECDKLRQWLYDNIYLSGHYPFDRVIEILENTLSDGKITEQESCYITSTINELLNPIETLKVQINSIDGKHVCLSGNFAYGSRSEVEKYVKEHGGIIDASIKKTTDILLIGAYESQSYSNGTYGTKVKKAIEYNEKGCHIQIAKESDFLCI